MLNVALVFFLLKKFLRFKFGRHPKKSTAQTLCNPRGCLTSGPHHSWLLSLKRLTLPQYMAYGRNAVQIEMVPYFFFSSWSTFRSGTFVFISTRNADFIGQEKRDWSDGIVFSVFFHVPIGTG